MPGVDATVSMYSVFEKGVFNRLSSRMCVTVWSCYNGVYQKLHEMAGAVLIACFYVQEKLPAWA